MHTDGELDWAAQYSGSFEVSARQPLKLMQTSNICASAVNENLCMLTMPNTTPLTLSNILMQEDRSQASSNELAQNH
jgi:hypothetical protein